MRYDISKQLKEAIAAKGMTTVEFIKAGHFDPRSFDEFLNGRPAGKGVIRKAAVLMGQKISAFLGFFPVFDEFKDRTNNGYFVPKNQCVTRERLMEIIGPGYLDTPAYVRGGVEMQFPVKTKSGKWIQ